MPLAKPAKPDAITAVPTPVPLRTDRANFAARGDAMMGWFPTGIAGVNTTLTYFGNAVNFVEQEANEAEASATAAAASNVAAAGNAAAAAASAGATVWVTGTTYAAGVVRYSPTDYQAYRDTAGGLSSTDPASDTTGRWQSAMLPSAEAIALPAVMPTIAINALAGASNVSVQVTRAMEKYRYNRLGYLVADAAGVLGVDHDPATKAPRGWKIDPQTVYLPMRSTEMDNAAYWPGTNTTVTAAQATGIDGTLSAYKVAATASAVTTYPRSVTATAASQYVAIRAAKGSGATDCNSYSVVNTTTAATLAALTINYDTGAITQTVGTGATATLLSAGIYDIRIPLTTGITVGNTLTVNAGFTGAAETAGEYAYIHSPTVADKPNASPHPTAGSNITRPADVLTVTGPDFSDNYNQGEGTFLTVAEMPVSTAINRILVQVDDGTRNERIMVSRNTAGQVSANSIVGNVFSPSATVMSVSNFLFSVASYKANELRMTVRGVAAATSTTSALTTVTLNRMVIGGTAIFADAEIGGWLKALYYYPIAVSAGESRALVTHA